MKKFLTFALVLTMVFALAVPALAATEKIAGEIDGAVLYSVALADGSGTLVFALTGNGNNAVLSIA